MAAAVTVASVSFCPSVGAGAETRRIWSWRTSASKATPVTSWCRARTASLERRGSSATLLTCRQAFFFCFFSRVECYGNPLCSPLWPVVVVVVVVAVVAVGGVGGVGVLVVAVVVVVPAAVVVVVVLVVFFVCFFLLVWLGGRGLGVSTVSTRLLLICAWSLGDIVRRHRCSRAKYLPPSNDRPLPCNLTQLIHF